MANTPSILLLCEYPALGVGISSSIKAHGDLNIYVESSISNAQSTLNQYKIDVALIELFYLKSSGLLVLKEILKSNPELKIIVLGRGEREPFISKSFEYGALGFISLKCDCDELLPAIKKVMSGEKYLSRQVAVDYAMANLEKNDQLFSVLTEREYQVFVLLAKGKSANEIADQLHLSPKTIHVYRANILEKLRAKNSSELTLLALKHGIISIDSIH